MPRYAFKGQFAFATTNARNQFSNAVQNYIDSNPTVFNDVPVNQVMAWHGLTIVLVRSSDMSNRQGLDALFAAMKQQAINRGAIAPSFMWLKQVADGGGVVDSVYAAAADGWVDVSPSPE